MTAFGLWVLIFVIDICGRALAMYVSVHASPNKMGVQPRFLTYRIYLAPAALSVIVLSLAEIPSGVSAQISNSSIPCVTGADITSRVVLTGSCTPLAIVFASFSSLAVGSAFLAIGWLTWRSGISVLQRLAIAGSLILFDGLIRVAFFILVIR